MGINPIQPASEVAAELQGRQPETQDLQPKEKREYTFSFEHKDDRGKIWRGPFTNQVLSQTQKLQVGVVRAAITGRVPYESLDPYSCEYSERIAYMTISLIKRPDWAQELGDVLDSKIIDALYEEVMSHEATFHRRGPDQAKGKAAAKDAAGVAAGVAQRSPGEAV
jgi:hypothetical protein